MQQIRKDRVLAAMVKAFFQYFVTGIIESQSKCDIQERFEPRNVKQVMLNNYEQVSRYYNKEAFYLIFRMNYEVENMEQVLRDFVTSSTTEMDLVRLACRTNQFYATMVNEYKRNFELLLCGRLATSEEHEQNYTRCEQLGVMDLDIAQSLVNKMAANAYAHGQNIQAAK